MRADPEDRSPGRIARIGCARLVSREPMFPLSVGTLLQCWNPDLAVAHYGRIWRVSRPRPVEDRVNGRLGFIVEGRSPTLTWDERRHDFIEGAAASGAFVPFAVDVRAGLIAFQLAPPDIKAQSFAGAFQSHLNANGTFRWHVRVLTRHTTFEQWYPTVGRVTRFRFVIRQPNPNWTGRERVQRIVESLRTQTMQLAGRAAPGEGIDADSEEFHELVAHAILGYGEATVGGEELTSGEATEWRSTGSGAVATQTEVVVRDGEQVSEEQLAEALVDSRRHLEEHNDPNRSGGA